MSLYHGTFFLYHIKNKSKNTYIKIKIGITDTKTVISIFNNYPKIWKFPCSECDGHWPLLPPDLVRWSNPHPENLYVWGWTKSFHGKELLLLFLLYNFPKSSFRYFPIHCFPDNLFEVIPFPVVLLTIKYKRVAIVND